MSRLAIIAALILALSLAIPMVAGAEQPNTPDQQAMQDQFAQYQGQANQYEDQDDGQLLKLFSYVLLPIGNALEWTITRPLHYLATESAAAPAFKTDAKTYYDEPVYPIQPLPPPDQFPPDQSETAAQSTELSATQPKASPAVIAPPSGNQPMLH